MPFLEAVTLVKDLVLTAAAGVGIYAALKGLSTWQRQLRGSVEYELARRLIKNAYRMRVAFNAVRHPAIYSVEYPQQGQGPVVPLDEPEREFRNMSHVYTKRWEKVSTVWADLQTDLLESEALWGRPAVEGFTELDKLAKTLSQAVRVHIGLLNPKTSDQMRSHFEDQDATLRTTLYDFSGIDEVDAFTAKVNEIIQQIERLLRPHLQG